MWSTFWFSLVEYFIKHSLLHVSWSIGCLRTAWAGNLKEQGGRGGRYFPKPKEAGYLNDILKTNPWTLSATQIYNSVIVFSACSLKLCSSTLKIGMGCIMCVMSGREGCSGVLAAFTIWLLALLGCRQTDLASWPVVPALWKGTGKIVICQQVFHVQGRQMWKWFF